MTHFTRADDGGPSGDRSGQARCDLPQSAASRPRPSARSADRAQCAADRLPEATSKGFYTQPGYRGRFQLDVAGQDMTDADAFSVISSPANLARNFSTKTRTSSRSQTFMQSRQPMCWSFRANASQTCPAASASATPPRRARQIIDGRREDGRVGDQRWRIPGCHQ